jgi:hypothetical protein
MTPAEAVQVTAVLEAPVTVAENCCWAPGWTNTGLGETVTVIPAAGVGVGLGAELVTVMVADPVFVESVVLVAVTIQLPEKFGAI